jgi:hypothetical protein
VTRPRRGHTGPKGTAGRLRVRLLRRRSTRTIAVVLLATVALLGGLRIWQNDSRSDALRAYARGLADVQDRIFERLSPGSLENLFELVEQFRRDQITAARFRAVAESYERDFASTRDAICPGAVPWGESAQHCVRLPLRPPAPLVRANELVARAFDMYAGVARMYAHAATLREAVDAATPAQKTRLRDEVTRVLDDALRWRQRADEIYDAGNEQIDALKRGWHVASELPPIEP